MEFETIRKSLRSYLHQDYDFNGTVSDALLAAARHGDVNQFIRELNELATRSDEVVQEVLDDHDVYLWDSVTPRALLITLRTLAELSKPHPDSHGA